MTYKFFVGIDLGKSSVDICVLEGLEKVVSTIKVENDYGSLQKVLGQIQQDLGFRPEEALFCMEHTGIYGNLVVAVLVAQNAHIWIEHAENILKSIGMRRGKSDELDAHRIAQYAARFQDKVRLYEPPRKIIQELSALSTLRERLVGILNQLEVPLKEAQIFLTKSTSKLLNNFSQASITAIKADIKSVEEKIRQLIEEDEHLQNLMKLIKSVPGVGEVTASTIIIRSNEFKNFASAKQFACHAGYAPFQHTSGTSIRGKTRTSKKADARLKSLIHMCAMSILSSKSSLKEFYTRKRAEGKHHLSAIHALGNKLIRIIFAVVGKNTIYQKNYQYSLVKP